MKTMHGIFSPMKLDIQKGLIYLDLHAFFYQRFCSHNIGEEGTYVLNGNNCGMSTQVIQNLLKYKELWQINNVIVHGSKNKNEKFMANWKKDKVVGITMTYISRQIQFHASQIDYMNGVWNMLKTFLDMVDKS